MKILAGELSVFRHGLISEDEVVVELKDSNSRDKVIEIHIGLADFTRALTGLSGVDVNYSILEDMSKLGLEKHLRTVSFPHPVGYTRTQLAELVRKDFKENKYEEEGWQLFNDGTDRQQDYKNYKYTLVRWTNAE